MTSMKARTKSRRRRPFSRARAFFPPGSLSLSRERHKPSRLEAACVRALYRVRLSSGITTLTMACIALDARSCRRQSNERGTLRPVGGYRISRPRPHGRARQERLAAACHASYGVGVFTTASSCSRHAAALVGLQVRTVRRTLCKLKVAQGDNSACADCIRCGGRPSA